MITQHAKEPWATEYRKSILGGYAQEIFDQSGSVIATMAWYPVTISESAIGTNREASAIRIIRCVNALEGLNDFALAGGWSFRGIEAYAKGLETQRDELLAALEECRRAMHNYRRRAPRSGLGNACAIADKAISDAKGGES